MPQLLDHNGQPIDMTLLKSQVAAPTPYGVRTVGSANSFTGLDPARLASLLRAAENTDARAYLELAEEMEEKYLHYAAQLATRKRAVCGLPWQVVPASERLRDRKIAELVEKLIPLLEEHLFDMLDSLGKGYSVTEITWASEGANWLPVALDRRDPRWYLFDKVDGRTLRLRDISNPITGLDLPPGKFIISHVAAKSGLPIRGGLARAAAYAYLFHNFSLRDWVTFCERFGLPLRLGRYHEGASGNDLDVLFSAVRDIGADAAAILPKGMEIEFPAIKSGNANADLWERLLAYLDSQVSKLILGQTLTADTGKGGGGSFALGKVHNEVRIDILRADAKAICAALNRDLVKTLVDLNFGPQDVYPALRLPVSEPEDMVALAGNLKTLVELGQPVGANWVSDKFSVPLPQAGELVLGKPATPPADVVTPAMQRAAHRATGQRPAPTDLLTGQLATAAQQSTDDLLANLALLIDESEDLASLQSSLLTHYGDLDTAELTRIMAAAFALAELKGMDAVTSENVSALHTARHAAQPTNEIHVHFPAGMVQNDVHVPQQPAAEVVVHNTLHAAEQPAPIVSYTINVPEMAAPAVHVTNQVQPAEVALHLPARKIETAILRDEKGVTVGATQIETDLN